MNYFFEKGAELPPEFQDRALTDNLEGFREFHLTNKVVVIYRARPGVVLLVNVDLHDVALAHRKHKRKGREKKVGRVGLRDRFFKG